MLPEHTTTILDHVIIPQPKLRLRYFLFTNYICMYIISLRIINLKLRLLIEVYLIDNVKTVPQILIYTDNDKYNSFLLIQYIGQPNHNFCSVILGDIWVPDYLKYLTSANLLRPNLFINKICFVNIH